MKLYQRIASALQAMENCKRSENHEWYGRHRQTIVNLVEAHMPSGSGIDLGTQLDFDASRPNHLVFTAPYHHMNDGGYYDGWTDHQIVITPDLATGFDLKVTGRDRNQIKEYFGELFGAVLDMEISEADYRAACGVTEAA